MKAHTCLIVITLVLMLELIKASSLKKCTKSSCKFGGTCVNGYCSCQAACRKAGIIVLCGSDKKYYFNYCFLMMRSCELQQEIKVVEVGHNRHCRGNPMRSFSQERHIATQKSFCTINRNHCQNYGVCVIVESSSHCLCPYGYSGDRCQFKIAPLSNVEYNRKNHAAKQIGTLKETDIDPESYVTWLLLFCALSALLSAVVTSGFCHRNLHKKLKRIKTERENANRISTINIQDSRSDEISIGNDEVQSTKLLPS